MKDSYFVGNFRMPQSFLFYHLIIFPKELRPVLRENLKLLCTFIEHDLRRFKCEPFAIDGSDDHIHIVMQATPVVSTDDIVEEIWQNTAEWIAATNTFPMFAGWERNYVVWSFSAEEKENLMREIRNQSRLHKTTTLCMELRSKGLSF